MHDIEMHEASPDFVRCWQAAGRHIERQAQGPFKGWMKASLTPPYLEHLSFRLGNQLFFVRVEDADGNLSVPGNATGLLAVANGFKGHPCIMRMRRTGDDWVADDPGWGLLNVRTGRAVDPPALVTDELIEMTDWELQDFAVQIVRDHLRDRMGKKLMSWQSNPSVDPSIWFMGESGPEWVVVRAVRYPREEAERPRNWDQIAANAARQGDVGHFASVAVANADDDFKGKPKPLWRGHGMFANFKGLQPS